MFQQLKYDYSSKISNFKLKQNEQSEQHQQIISNYIRNGLFNQIKQNVKTDIKKQNYEKQLKIFPHQTNKFNSSQKPQLIKKINNFEIYTDIQWYDKETFIDKDIQTSNKIQEVTKKISKIYQNEKQRNDKTINKVRRWLQYWLVQQNLPYQQKIQDLLNKKSSGVVKIKRDLQYVQQNTQQQIDPWTLIPRSHLIQGLEYVNKYPVYKNMISYNNIPNIKYKIVYQKYIKKMNDPEKDLDNVYNNYRFLTQFLKFPFQFNRLSEMEDINSHILKILYDLTSKSFQIGSLCKDLKKRTHTRIQKQQEYTDNFSQELLNIMKPRLDKEFVDYILVSPYEMLVSLQEFVTLMRKYQYDDSQDNEEVNEESFHENTINN